MPTGPARGEGRGAGLGVCPQSAGGLPGAGLRETAGNWQDLVLPRDAVGFGSATAREQLSRAGGGGTQTSALPSRMALFSPPTW